MTTPRVSACCGAPQWLTRLRNALDRALKEAAAARYDAMANPAFGMVDQMEFKLSAAALDLARALRLLEEMR